MAELSRQKIASNNRRAVTNADNVITVQNATEIDVAEMLLITDGDTSPSVSDGYVFQTNNTGATLISNFDNAIGNGQKITVHFNDNDTILKHIVGTLELENGIDESKVINDISEFLRIDDIWYGWTGRSQ